MEQMASLLMKEIQIKTPNILRCCLQLWRLIKQLFVDLSIISCSHALSNQKEGVKKKREKQSKKGTKTKINWDFIHLLLNN